MTATLSCCPCAAHHHLLDSPQCLFLTLQQRSAARLVSHDFLMCCREGGRTAHDGAVVGVAAEASNKLLVSGGYDGRLCIWGFKSRRLASEIHVGSPLTRLCHHRTSALLSVACDDLVIRMCAAGPPQLACWCGCPQEFHRTAQLPVLSSEYVLASSVQVVSAQAPLSCLSAACLAHASTG